MLESKFFVDRAKSVANCKTLYVLGAFGAPLTDYQKKRYKNEQSYNSRTDRSAKIDAADASTFAFDCVGLIKSILWGFSADTTKTYGGAIYKANGVPDLSADQMIAKCKEVSASFGNIVAGEVVWKKGHIGIYIGNNLVIECTPSGDDGVQISGLNTKAWQKHGKLPYVDYSIRGAGLVLGGLPDDPVTHQMLYNILSERGLI